MGPPPKPYFAQLNTPLPDRRRVQRSRAVIVQCDRCDAIATGTVVGFRLTSAQLPIVYGYRSMTHANCGGSVRAYDTSEVGA
jgi:hypothetical protein